MFNEIKFSEYVDTGKVLDRINLPDFLKVYLNHRPPFGNTMDTIQMSFDILGYTNAEGKKAIRREDLLRLLLTKGEPGGRVAGCPLSASGRPPGERRAGGTDAPWPPASLFIHF